MSYNSWTQWCKLVVSTLGTWTGKFLGFWGQPAYPTWRVPGQREALFLKWNEMKWNKVNGTWGMTSEGMLWLARACAHSWTFTFTHIYIPCCSHLTGSHLFFCNLIECVPRVNSGDDVTIGCQKVWHAWSFLLWGESHQLHCIMGDGIMGAGIMGDYIMRDCIMGDGITAAAWERKRSHGEVEKPKKGD